MITNEVITGKPLQIEHLAEMIEKGHIPKDAYMMAYDPETEQFEPVTGFTYGPDSNGRNTVFFYTDED